LTFVAKAVYIAFIEKKARGYLMTTDAAALERHLATFDEMEARGARLLDAGVNPAKFARDLLCVLLRLQCEGRFMDVDVARLEDAVEQIVKAQEAEQSW
jgi:hypothetical protein